MCATPRSGSTLLCETLRASGVAGRPEEPFQRLEDTGLAPQPRDFFRGVDDVGLLDRLPERRIGALVDAEGARARLQQAFAEDTTDNGVFGTKLMWHYLGDFLAGARSVTGQSSDDRDIDVLRAVFGPDVQLLHVQRRDKLGQAISLWKAIQLQQWRDEDPAAGPSGVPDLREGRQSGHADVRREVAEYHGEAIAHLRRLMIAHEAAWATWFAEQGVQPLRTVVYEELVPTLEATALDVLGALGIEDAPADGFATPRMRRQSDGTSAEWRARWIAEHPDFDGVAEERG